MAKRKRTSPPLTIKGVKSHGYSPVYEARLIRGIRKARKSGKKPTRQLARGHKKKEHIIRAQKERERSGISSTELKGIRSFIKRFNASGRRDIPDEETLVEFVQERGYKAFTVYRGTWDAARTKYKAEIADGTWENRGLQYLNHLTGMAGVDPQGTNIWLYYH